MNEQSIYPSKKVNIFEIKQDDSNIYIYYTIPLETLYYSSGVDYKYINSFSEIEARFIRQNIKSKKKPKSESILLKNTNDSLRIAKYGINTYLVKIPNKLKINKELNIEEIIVIKD